MDYNAFHTDKGLVKIPIKKTKLIGSMIAAHGIVLIGIGGYVVRDEQTIVNPLALYFFSLFISITAFMYIIFLCKILIRNQYGIFINTEGIVDKTGLLSKILIRWQDIKSLKVVNLPGNFWVNKTKLQPKILLIYVFNSEEYINKTKGFVRIYMYLTQKKYGTPLYLSSNLVNCEFKKLVALVEKYASINL